MPRSYRYAILALVGWLSLAGTNSPSEQRKAGEASVKAQPASAKPPELPSPPSVYAPYPDRYSDACYQAKDKDAADLCAQWRAAIGSEKAAREARRATNWSIIATAVSVIGLGGLFWALRQSSEANLAAVNAERPHVRFYRTIKKTGTKGQIIDVLGVNFRNYGRTPALVKSLAIDFRISDRPPMPSEAAASCGRFAEDMVMAQDEEWPRKSHIKGWGDGADFATLIAKHNPEGERLFAYGVLKQAFAACSTERISLTIRRISGNAAT